jgi:hypothetical protein
MLEEARMSKLVLGFAALLFSLLPCGDAAAWSHSGAFGTASGGGGSWSASGYRGGSASGGDGSWSGTGFRGGSASGGDGSWSGTGYRGGTASGSDGSWHATGADGGTASGGGGAWHATGPYGSTAYGGVDHYYGGTYATYHPPTVVNSYYGSGCTNCGGWPVAGAAAAGGFLGARLAAQQEAAAAAAAPVVPSYTMGEIVPTLPAGCALSNVAGTSYYNCGGTWLSPSFGANGVYYRVVPGP